MRPVGHFLGNRDQGGHIFQAAAQQLLPSQFAPKAVAGQGLEVLQIGGGQVLLLPFRQDGLGQRMLAFGFQSQRQGQKLLLADALLRHQIRHLGGTLGNGAGFVQNYDVGLAGLLQADGSLEEDAVPGTYAVAHHNGNRGGKAQGAGAADDQHRDAPGQGVGKALAQQKPDHGGDDGNGNDRRHEHTGNLIGDLGNGGLGSGRVGDHPDDLGQGGVLPHPGSPAAQEAGLVHRSGGDTVPRCLIHGDALAGEGRLVHGPGALQHHAVHRDVLPGADHKLVSLLDLLNGYGDLFAILHNHRRLWCQLHQALQGIGGFALGPGLQHFAYGDEGQDHGGGLKIEFVHVHHDPVHIPMDLGIRHGKQGIDTPDKGGHGAQGHQAIHIGCLVFQGGEAADEELLIDDHDDPGQQELHQAHGHMVPMEPGRQGPAKHHVAHGEIHKHRQEAQGIEKPLFELGGLMVCQGILLALLLRLALGARSIARLLDRLNDLSTGGSPLHAHRIGQEADGAGCDSRHRVYRLFHPGRAGGAAHARDIVLFHTILLLRLYFMSFCRMVTSSSMTSSFPSRMSRATHPSI